MHAFLPKRLVHQLIGLAAVGTSWLSSAQVAAEAPAAAVHGTCRNVEFNRASLSSHVTVDVLARIDDKGRVTSAAPLSEVSNSALVSAVLSSVMTCKYVPATARGIPTSGTARLVYQFDPAVAASPLRRGPAITNVQDCAPTADDYPPASRQLNETGTTRISFTVSPEGRLTSYGVTRSSGYLRLDFTALIKLAACRFRAGTAADGTPISETFEVDYVWKLE